MGTPTDQQRTTDGSAVPDAAAGDAHAPGRGHLSRERIVAGAIGYVGRNCLADLSMRRLGNELGVEAMSLYRYFPSKAALFDAVVDAAVGQMTAPDGEAPDWEAAVRRYVQSFRRFARSQPRLFPLLASAGPSQRSVGALAERMLDMWRRAGLDEATARYAQRAVHAFTIGAIAAEIGVSFGPPDEDRNAWCAGPFATGAATTGGATRTGADAMDPSVDGSFEFSLNVLIEGLRDRFVTQVSGPAPA